jgi:glutathione S-transferase
MIYHYPNRHTNDNIDTKNKQEIRIIEMFTLLNNELNDKIYLLGNNISICDFYLFMLCQWVDNFKVNPLLMNNLKRYLNNLSKRKSIIDVCKFEKINLDKFN